MRESGDGGKEIDRQDRSIYHRITDIDFLFSRRGYTIGMVQSYLSTYTSHQTC